MKCGRALEEESQGVATSLEMAARTGSLLEERGRRLAAYWNGNIQLAFKSQPKKPSV